MKKIITLIVIILIIGGLGIVFLPGVFVYAKMKIGYKSFNTVFNDFTQYDVSLPRDSNRVSISGDYGDYSLAIPKEFERVSGNVYDRVNGPNGKSRIYAMEIRLDERLSDYCHSQYIGISEKKIDKYFKAINKEVPRNIYESETLTNELSWDDFKIWNPRSVKMFKTYAEAKEQTKDSYHRTELDECYNYENDFVKGFLTFQKNGKINEKIYVCLYDKNDTYRAIFIIIKLVDDETAFGIINSIRIEI